MYVKLFASLYQGTLRGKSDEILVFTNLLAYADRYGIVDKHPRAIADETGLSIEDVSAAIQTLESPDPESRSPNEEGRRILRLDEHRAWGWQVTNYEKYRAIRNEDERREQNRLSQEVWRNKQNKQNKPESAADNQGKPMQREKQIQKKKIKSVSTAFALPDVDPQVLADWLAVRKAKRAAVTETAIKGIRAEAEKAGLSMQAVLTLCCERGWAGFKASWDRGDTPAGGNGSGKSGKAPWWSSNESIVAKGQEVGIEVRNGESWQDLRGRINARIENGNP